jgi:hypothetical protein
MEDKSMLEQMTERHEIQYQRVKELEKENRELKEKLEIQTIANRKLIRIKDEISDKLEFEITENEDLQTKLSQLREEVTN